MKMVVCVFDARGGGTQGEEREIGRRGRGRGIERWIKREREG